MIHIEYDDGKPVKFPNKEKVQVTRKGRASGFYAVDGAIECLIPVGFMRISEMKSMEVLLNQVRDWKPL